MLEFVESCAELNVNVKLDRMVTSTLDSKKQITMLQSYCEVGRYLTLFDIGISGVGASLDDRRGFERRIFGTAYDGLDHERPRYGSLNLMTYMKGTGKASRYGKSYIILNEHARKRCTITSCDTSRPEAVLGTLDCCAHVLLHAVELCVSDLRTALERVDRAEAKLRDAKQADQRAQAQSKLQELRAALKQHKSLDEFEAQDTKEKKDEYLRKLDERKRVKFLQQLHGLVNWDGAKDFSKVDAQLKR